MILEWFGMPVSMNGKKGVNALAKFKSREGHCIVPINHKEEGYPLGRWVNRRRARRSQLSEAQQKRLEDIGMIWDVPKYQWEEAVKNLKKFKLREGHCNVPKAHKEDDYPLGTWVNNRKSKWQKLSPEKQNQLLEIGFEVSN